MIPKNNNSKSFDMMYGSHNNTKFEKVTRHFIKFCHYLLPLHRIVQTIYSPTNSMLSGRSAPNRLGAK